MHTTGTVSDCIFCIIIRATLAAVRRGHGTWNMHLVGDWFLLSSACCSPPFGFFLSACFGLRVCLAVKMIGTAANYGRDDSAIKWFWMEAAPRTSVPQPAPPSHSSHPCSAWAWAEVAVVVGLYVAPLRKVSQRQLSKWSAKDANKQLMAPSRGVYGAQPGGRRNMLQGEL